jgi:hypothetical protein
MGLSYDEVFAALHRLLVGQVSTVAGVPVHRVDRRHWSVDGGPPSSLVVSIDRVRASAPGIGPRR